MSNHNEEKPKKYYILHVPGGGLWGIHPAVVMDFIEKMTQLPISRQFNMSAGSSTGAIATTSINIPKSKGSREPRYAAADILHLYKTVGPKIFPPRSFYYPRQILVDQVIRKIHEFAGAFFAWGLGSMDRGLNAAVNKTKKWVHKDTGDSSPFNPVDIKFFRTIHKCAFAPLEKKISKGIDRMVKNSLYDISILGRILGLAFRYEDSHEPVPLDDTLMTHHVSAMNLTTNKPALFFHYRDSETGETKFVSTDILDTKDITMASCAAQSRFEAVKLRNGNRYVDIAHFDTVLTPIISLDRHSDKKLDIHLVSIGTGESPRVNPESLNGMLFLRQMSSENGAPLFSLPQRYVNEIANMSLEQRLPRENIIDINLPVSLESQKGDYLRDPRAAKVAHAMGLDLQQLSQASLPSHDICDSKPENMNNMVLFGWLMVMKNLNKLFPLCSELVENAHEMGNITRDEADLRLKLINDFASASAPEPHIQPATPEHKQDWSWLAFEDVRARTMREKLKYVFQRALGREPDPAAPRKQASPKKEGDNPTPPPPQ